MPCSRTQHGDACGVRTQDLSIRSPTLYHYATALPFSIFDHILAAIEHKSFVTTAHPPTGKGGDCGISAFSALL